MCLHAAIPVVGSWREAATVDMLLSCPPIPQVDELDRNRFFKGFQESQSQIVYMDQFFKKNSILVG